MYKDTGENRKKERSKIYPALLRKVNIYNSSFCNKFNPYEIFILIKRITKEKMLVQTETKRKE